MRMIGLLFIGLAVFMSHAFSKNNFKVDTVSTSTGKLMITFIGHGTLMFEFEDRVIHVDPVAREADYTQLPKGDLVLITHEHGDHLDHEVLEMVKKENTVVVLTDKCFEKGAKGVVMKNGDTQTIMGLKIEAVPAYNLIHKRDNGQPFHPKGIGNGYVIDFGDKRVYIAGDTENIPEMKTLKEIDIAFLPMNVPYTMSPEMVADAARSFNPKVLYPYHYGRTDPNRLVELLRDTPNIEVRIRDMK